MATTLSICNMALAEIGADTIASLDESSVSARECNRVFNQCIEEMLEWSEWQTAIKRATLAEVANDRFDEWNYAFALPADLGTAILVRVHSDDTSQRDYPIAGPFTFPHQDAVQIPFLIAGEKLYCNVEVAILEYGAKTIDVTKLSAMGARALTLEIASRIAYPIKKDAKLKDALIRQAEVAKSRAIADNENRNPRRTPEYVSPVDYARMGIVEDAFFPTDGSN